MKFLHLSLLSLPLQAKFWCNCFKGQSDAIVRPDKIDLNQRQNLDTEDLLFTAHSFNTRDYGRLSGACFYCYIALSVGLDIQFLLGLS